MFPLSAAASARLPALSRPLQRPHNEPDDIYESNEAAIGPGFIQPAPSIPRPESRPSTSSASSRTLRRTRRFEVQTLAQTQVPFLVGSRRRSRNLRAEPRDSTFQSASEGDESSTFLPRPDARDSIYWPRRSTRISKRTASAILYALEEALRKPYPFTLDEAELNASMSDLLGGSSAPGPGNNGRPQNGGSRPPTGAVPATGQQPSRADVRTPVDIMRVRRQREEAREEAKKKAEAEAKLREENEPQEDPIAPPPVVEQRTTQRRSGVPSGTKQATRDPASQGYDDGKGIRVSNGNSRVVPPSSQQPSTYPMGTGRDKLSTMVPTVEPLNVPSARTRPRSSSTTQPKAAPQTQAPRATSSTYGQQQTTRPRRSSTATAQNSQTRIDPSIAPSAAQPQPPQEGTSGPQPRSQVSSFPHAFERWETLSSQWEGLTSYWIRRLQQNTDDLNREPLNQQLARQVTDLSAAGANLFHAVVELQRLRASSERKFQRWFFDTREQQETARETQAKLERDLNTERRAREKAIADLVKSQQDNRTAVQSRFSDSQERREMQRELQISKEEARRAWEELGRREQEERDRTTSLRAGEPTLVGGVQVVPMGPGGPSRQTSTNRPSTRDGPSGIAALQTAQTSVESPTGQDRGYTTYDPAHSETDTDPFTEVGRGNTSRGTYSSAAQPQQQTSASESAAVQAARAAYPHPGNGNATPGQPSPSFYQHEGSSLQQQEQHGTFEADERSYVPSAEGSLSEGEYMIEPNGEFRRDAQGRRIPFQRGPGSEDSDEYDVRDQLERERMYGQRYGSGISGVEYGSGSTAIADDPNVASEAPQPPVDYSGAGYGQGWEAVPRHHHPTRLSDILEEDARSRTSPSRASQATGGAR